jgi:LysM repeat protein
MVELQEMSDFKYPRRWPWLLLVLLVIGGGVYWARREKPERPAVPDEPTQPIAVKPAVEARAPQNPQRSPIADMDVNLLLSEGRAFENRGELPAARKRYLELLRRNPAGAVRREVEERLGKVNTELVFSPVSMPEKTEYVVQSGDFLGKIAKKFGTTVEMIQKGNKLANPNVVKLGDRLWLLQGKFRILVSKKRNELTLFFNEEFFKKYSVSTGKDGKTPEGTFKITDKSVEPVWWRPDGKEVPYGNPENILGTRWMTLRATGETADVRGYGIHGTWDETSIGKAESAGCIRMRNKDVEELYTLVPGDAPVEIVE